MADIICVPVKRRKRERKFISKGTFHVYILRCEDGTYYTGHTNDLERRLKQHKSGKGGALYTKWKGARGLAWSKRYRNFKEAFLTELRIKKLTRQEKDLLIRRKRFDRLPLKVKNKLL